MATDRDPIVAAHGASFRYAGSDANALESVDLAIARGEFLAFVGQNGAGKTTLAKLFNGLLTPTTGDVVVDGSSTHKVGIDFLSKIVGYCYQNPDHQIFSNTVREEVAFGLKHHGVPAAAAAESVTEALRLVGLEHQADRYPFLLGRGERQKLAVASILALGPPVLVIDEPTTGLDLGGTRSIMRLLRQLNESGRTVIIITHDMNVVAEYAPRTVVISKGRVIRDGSTRDVLTNEAALREAFLRPPQITRVALRLHERCGFPAGILTVDEFLTAYRSRAANTTTRAAARPASRGQG